jgi:hypothetical protein
MALDDLKSILGKSKGSKESMGSEEDEEMEESESSGSDDLVMAAKAVKASIDGDPKRFAKALKAFIKLCSEEDY